MIDREKYLPFYLTYIGETDRQPEINRPEGYYCPQIILCSKGSGILKYNGTESTVNAGSALFLPANAPHSYYPPGEVWSTHYISFAGYAADDLLRQLGLVNIGVFTVDIGIMRNIFRKIMSAVKSDRFYGGFTASALVYEYIIEFSRQTAGAENGYASEHASLTPVLNYIDEHFSDDIELEALCKIIGVSPQYLCRLFRDRLGIRPLEYIARRRIQQAKVYLAEGGKTVKEIAADVGYRDASYFGAVFKRCEGVSPKEYMRRET